MKSLLIALSLIIIPIFAYAIPGDCIAIIFHDTNNTPTNNADLPFIIVRWNEVSKTESALPVVMIKVKFGVFGPNSELQFSGEDYYRVDFILGSSFNEAEKLLIGAYTVDDSNNMVNAHEIFNNFAIISEVKSDGTQILGKIIPEKFIGTLFNGAVAQFYATEEGDFVELQERARNIDVGICAVG